MKKFILLSALGLLFTVSSLAQETPNTKIAWDDWGVPHISSDNLEDLFFAQGWAQMHNHANLILQLYGRSRGRGAEYWGKDKIMDDMLIHTLGFPKLADEWEEKQDPKTRLIYESFVDGLNAYAENHPESIDDELKQILPLTTKDVNMHSMFVVFTRFIAGDDLGRVQQWPDLGSNAYAVAPKRSASGNAMLVMNPHLPWFGEFLFFESHLMLDGKNMYGATLVGLPGIAIGYNQHLGWTHTNNVIDNSDVYEIELSDGGYLLDGEKKDFEVSQTVIKIRQDNDSIVEEIIQVMRTEHGPVVSKGENSVLTLRMVGLDKPNMLLQWWNMINSTNFEEFETALKMAEIPFWNVMYADKEGNIFYLFNGLVPKRTENDWAYWDRIIPGGKSSDIWTETHSYDDLPKIKNPESGWLQNANDPPWSSTIPTEINHEDYPGYMSPMSMYYRPQRSAKMLSEDSSITYEELIDYKHSTRIELADRLLDDLFEAIDANPNDELNEAKAVLEKWDRQANSDSKGTFLFVNWVRKFNYFNPNSFKTKWNKDQPLQTPDGIADAADALKKLEIAAKETKSRFGKLDPAWGDYYKIKHGDQLLAGNGLDGSPGVFRVAWSNEEDDNHAYITGGDSWVGVIEFGDSPQAKVLLSYGNATQKDNPNNGDQLELFSKKELRNVWFTQEQVEANTSKIQVLNNGKFE